jgi:hypothetical protein
MNGTQLKMKLEEMEKADKIGILLSGILFAVSVFFDGFHSDAGFRAAGGLGILVGLVMFIKSMVLNKKDKAGLWLSFLMFSASVFFQGFHYYLGFWTAGIFSLVSLAVLFCVWRKNKII